MLTVELLKRIVRQHDRTGLGRDLQDERIPPPNRTGGRRDQPTVVNELLVAFPLGVAYSIRERCITHDGRAVVGPVGSELIDGLDQLLEARELTTLGREVRSVDHDVR